MRILYIDIDTLRPDHLGCYGYPRNTSPTIDAIAAEGVRCENVHASDAPCLPSRAALYTGRFGIHTGVVSHGGTTADMRIDGPARKFRDRLEDLGLAGFLKAQGFHTAQISPFGERHSSRFFFAGFNEIHNTGSGGMESAEAVSPVVEKWLSDNAAKDNWFLHVNYWDPHTPYRTPEGHPNHFENDPLPEWLTAEALERHRAMPGPHTAQDLSMYSGNAPKEFPKQPGEIKDMDDMRRVIDGYDNGIRYADDQVAMIVEKLKAAGIYENTAIIISSDHGENFGELGIYAEHGTADQITSRIPMIIKWPGKTKPGAVDSGLHYNLDWPPTLAKLLGVESPEHAAYWDGQSYAKALTSGEDAGRDFLVLSQCAHVCQRSVRWENWLYMRTYHCGFHLFPQEMLFDLKADPYEQNNLAEERPDLCALGNHKLSQWHDEMMQTSESDTDPLRITIREGGPYHARVDGLGHPSGPDGFRNYLERLENTGRAGAAKQLKEKYLGKTS